MTDTRFELPEINTWRLFHKSVTQQGVVEMVEAWEAHGYRFGTVCIDDGWTEDGRLIPPIRSSQKPLSSYSDGLWNTTTPRSLMAYPWSLVPQLPKS